jgi:hypothetical protein
MSAVELLVALVFASQPDPAWFAAHGSALSCRPWSPAATAEARDPEIARMFARASAELALCWTSVPVRGVRVYVDSDVDAPVVLFSPSADEVAAACVRRIVGQWIPFRIHLRAPAVFAIEADGSIGWPCAPKSSTSAKQALSAKGASARAAELANEACKRRFGVRPFRPENWAIAQGSDGRWTWGQVDPAGPGGYSAFVSFEPDGGAPRVDVYLATDTVSPFNRFDRIDQ